MKNFAPHESFVLELGNQHNLFQGKNSYTASELAEHYGKLADQLADRFDQRNGNSNFRKQVNFA